MQEKGLKMYFNCPVNDKILAGNVWKKVYKMNFNCTPGIKYW